MIWNAPSDNRTRVTMACSFKLDTERVLVGFTGGLLPRLILNGLRCESVASLPFNDWPGSSDSLSLGHIPLLLRFACQKKRSLYLLLPVGCLASSQVPDRSSRIQNTSRDLVLQRHAVCA